jgi:hypothetical protein
MVHLGDELGFPLEAFLELCGEVPRGDELDGDLAIEERITSPVDDAHPSAPKLGDELIAVRKPGTDQRVFTKVRSRGVYTTESSKSPGV